MSISRRNRNAAVAAVLAATAAGTAFAAVAAASPASATSAPGPTSPASTRSAQPGWPGSWSANTGWPGSWSAQTGWPGPAAGGWWPGAGPATWTPGSAARTEYFHVVSTRPSGPGTIIITGVVNAGGTEKPGRAIDTAAFAGGSFRIDHSAGRPTVRFDRATCVGTITQTGPFKVIDTTGEMTGLAGSGRYVFRALYTTARAGAHCSATMTAYTETIEGVATVKA